MRKLGLAIAVVILAATTLPAQAQSDLGQARSDVAEIVERMDKAQARADRAAAKFSKAESDVGLTQVAIDDLAVELDLSEEELDELRGELRTFAIERYTGESMVVQALETEEINEYTIASSLARFTQLDNRDVVDDYRVTADRLDAAGEALFEKEQQQQQALDDIVSLRAEIDTELEVLAAERDQMQSVLDRLEAEERARIEAEIAAARRAAEEAAAEEAAREAPSTTVDEDSDTDPDEDPEEPAEEPEPTPAPTAPIASGTWICPVQGPVSFTDSWGAPRSGGRSHKGVDMLAATGTPVVAPVSGSVEHRGNSIGGMSFHLAGSDGNYYYGTHLSGYANGGSVQAGVVIGYVGATGNATTPHLHFEIHIGGYGNAVNPYPQVAAAC